MPYTKYRKPSQELMAKRRKEYEKEYEPEIDWLIGNESASLEVQGLPTAPVIYAGSEGNNLLSYPLI